jgi:hypothetical protein
MEKIPTFEEIINMAPWGVKSALEDCANTPQSPNWHPEGDVLIHTKIVYNRARNHGDWDLVLAALFHDLGKVETTKPNKHGDWSAYGHEYKSTDFVENYKEWIKEVGGNVERVKEVVKLHMKIKLIEEMKPSKQEALKKNPYYNDLLVFTDFDNMKTLTPEEFNYRG